MAPGLGRIKSRSCWTWRKFFAKEMCYVRQVSFHVKHAKQNRHQTPYSVIFLRALMKLEKKKAAFHTSTLWRTGHRGCIVSLSELLHSNLTFLSHSHCKYPSLEVQNSWEVNLLFILTHTQNKVCCPSKNEHK